MENNYLNLSELLNFLNLKRADLMRFTNKNDPLYDASFPVSVPIGGKRNMWRRADVEAWKFRRDMDAIEAAARR